MHFFKRKYYQILVNYLKKNSSDDLNYLKKQYYLRNEKKLNLENPIEFTEKIQWLKLNKYCEKYKNYADKFEVREIVAAKIGKEYLNELYGVYNSPGEINWQQLPEKFVLKGTHGSGYNLIVHSKKNLNFSEAEKQLQKFLDSDPFVRCREYIYKEISPRLIAEKYLEQENGQELVDYKLYCFEGKPTYVLVKVGNKKCFYDLEWSKILPDKNSNPRNFLEQNIPKPNSLKKMVQLASVLSAGFHFLRVDLYAIEQQIFFGELTFFPNGGIERLPIERLNHEFGALIHLENEKT